MAFAVSENSHYNSKIFDQEIPIKNSLLTQQQIILELQDNFNFTLPKIETAINEIILENSELKFKLKNQELEFAKMKQKMYKLTKLIESNYNEHGSKLKILEEAIEDVELEVDEMKVRNKDVLK